MRTLIEGNKFTVTVSFTRFKAAIVMILIGGVIWTPFHLLNEANSKLPQQTTQTPLGQTVITEPILSPFNLTPDTKLTLKNWLHYGYENGYDKMMSEYVAKNGNSETSKMFRYLIDSEWRLGGWEQLSHQRIIEKASVSH